MYCFIRSLILAYLALIAISVEGRLLSGNSQNVVHTIEQIDDDKQLPIANKNETRPQLLQSFAWSTCSGPDALAVINKLVVSEPLSIPGNVTITLDSYLSRLIESPLKVEVHISRKVGFIWIDVPCIDNIGSCLYEDICTAIPFPPDAPCPEPFISLGFPCHCPFPQGAYMAEKRTVHIPGENIPHFLTKGHYTVRVQAFSNDEEVVCLSARFDLA